MCELFGITSKSRLQVNKYLKTFFSHSEVHKHGWGLALFYGNAASIEKESVCANQSNYLRERIKQPIIIDNMIAHIRLASVGRVLWGNAHPFMRQDSSGRYWTLAHNGTIFDFPALDEYKNIQDGQTDSERILLYLIDKLDKRQHQLQRTLTEQERFLLVEEVITTMSINNKLNLLIWDGENMYVHTNYADTLHYLQKSEDATIFSTKPISEEDWQPVPFLRLLVFREGRKIFEGSKRSLQYFDPEENYEYNNHTKYEYAVL